MSDIIDDKGTYLKRNKPQRTEETVNILHLFVMLTKLVMDIKYLNN